MKLTKKLLEKYIDSRREIGISKKNLTHIFECTNPKAYRKLSDLIQNLRKEGKIFYENDVFKAKQVSKDPDLDKVCKKYMISHFLPKKAQKQSNGYKNFTISNIHRETKDLRSLFTITMDGLDAKDYDDAYSLEYKNNKYILYVHIADVSYFVPRNCPLDMDAYRRGNSFYLGKWVIPMLPEILSNELCSLKEGEDRLTLTIQLSIDNKGTVADTFIYNSIINVNKRIPYEHGNIILLDSKSENYEFLQTSLRLKNILLNKRLQEKSIEFNIDEYKLIFSKDNDLVPSEIKRVKRGDCESIIEEFMLIANKNVAIYLERKGKTLFRVHDKPQEEKITQLFQYLDLLGYDKPLNYSQAEIVNLIKSVKGTPDERLLNTYILRTMSQAEYSAKNIGHFGLGFDYYTHFTSPIRRYSDLIVHRIVNYFLGADTGSNYSEKELEEISTHVSKRERDAVEAERLFFKLKSARYIKKHLNKRFNAFVSGIIENGIFLEIRDNGVEGFVHARYLGKNSYFFDPKLKIFEKHQNKNDAISLGDEYIVEIDSVNVDRGFIDFKLYERVAR